MNDTATELILSCTDLRKADDVKELLEGLNSRLARLKDSCRKRESDLQSIVEKLSDFHDAVKKHDEWLTPNFDVVDSKERLPSETLGELSKELPDREQRVQEMQKMVKELVENPGTADVGKVRDAMADVSHNWNDFQVVLSAREKEEKACSEKNIRFELLRAAVMEWLVEKESQTDRLEPALVEVEVIQSQFRQLKPLLKEVNDFGPRIDELNEVGNAFETAQRGFAVSSPIQRKSRRALGRRVSTKLSPMSPVTSPVSPMSTSESSGISSKPTSSDNLIATEDLSDTQRHLIDIYQRYELLVERLNDRERELESLLKNVSHITEELAELLKWLDEKEQFILPLKTLPASEEEARKKLKEYQDIQSELLKKEALLGSLKTNTDDLVKECEHIPGIKELKKKLQNLESRWDGFHEISESGGQSLKEMVDDLKTFQASQGQLVSWLEQKEKMVSFLGSLAAEPGMVKNQMQQVELLREELGTQQNQYEQFIQKGLAIFDRIDPESADASQINRQIEEINNRWDKLSSRLGEREAALANMLELSTGFYDALQELSAWLPIKTDFVEGLASPVGAQAEALTEQRSQLKNLAEEMKLKKELVEKAQSECQQMCDTVKEPTTKFDLKNKLASIEKPFRDLERKIEERQTLLDSAEHEGTKFQSALDDVLQWIEAMDRRLVSLDPVSGDKDRLRQQIIDNEAIQNEMTSHEPELRLLFEKGQKMADNADSPDVAKRLDSAKSAWHKLRDIATEKNAKVKDVSKQAAKFYDDLETMLVWLGLSADKMASLPGISVDRKTAARQLEEAQSLQAELNRKGRDYELLRVDAEALKNTSDVTREMIDRQLSSIEEKWEKLFNTVNDRVNRLSEVEQKLEDFTDTLTDVTGSLQRVQDKLTDHLTLGPSAVDGRYSEKIQGLVEQLNAVEPQIDCLKEMIDRFAGEGVSSSQVADLIDSHSAVLQEFDGLWESLADVRSRMETASNSLGDFQSQVKQVSVEIQELEDELKGEGPPGRDIDFVSNQISNLRTFQQRLDLCGINVDQLVTSYENLVENACPADADDAKKQIELLRRHLTTLKDAAMEHEHLLTSALQDLEKFHKTVEEIMEEMKTAAQSEILHPGQVKDDLEAIKQEQQLFKSFQKDDVDPLLRRYEEARKFGQELVRSAASNVRTSDLESGLERLDSTWSALNDKLVDYERKLNFALLKSGKFKEALESLLSWLTDTEELMANQALSSFDHKVIKSQVQMQKMIQRMLEERRDNVESMKSTAQDVIAQADPKEKQVTSGQLHNLVTRWQAINEAAAAQLRLLEASLVASTDYQDKAAPFTEWLESAEKKLAGMEPIGVNASSIQKQIEEQMKLNAEISSRKLLLDEVVLSGAELKKHFGTEDAGKLDKSLVDLKTRYGDLTSSCADRLNKMEEASPIARRFQDTHEKLIAWLQKMEPELQGKEATGPEAEKQLQQLQELCDEFKPLMEVLNETGSQLSGLASGTSAATVTDILVADNKKFDAVTDQLRKRADRITMQRQKSMELLGEIDDLIEFFSETERQIAESDCVSSAPEKLREQLNDHKALHDELIVRKSKTRDVLSAAKRLCRESTFEEDPVIKDKLEDLRQQADGCVKQSNDRLNVIEQALPLAVDFLETLTELTGWLEEMEETVEEQEPPAITAEQIREQQDRVKLLKQNIADGKPLIDRLNKTGSVLVKLVGEEETEKMHVILEDVTAQFDFLKNNVRERSNFLEDALLQTSQFSDKLENLLECLETVATQVTKEEPISAYPDKLSEQIADNRAIIEDMDKKLAVINSMKANADEMMSQSDASDGGSIDLKEKIFHLLDTFETIQQATHERIRVLEETYSASEKFWENFNVLSGTVKEIQESIADQELPGFEPNTIKEQQETLETLKEDLDVAHLESDNLHEAGEELVGLIGEPDKPEIERNVEDIDASLKGISDSWLNRQKELDEALQRATTFQEELMKMLVWIQKIEDRLDGMGIIPAETNALREQMTDLKDLTDDVLPRHLDIQELNNAVNEMTKNSTSEQAAVIKDPINDINRRWDALNENIASRMGTLQKALISLGHFHAVMNEQLTWLDSVYRQLDEAPSVYGDPQLIERELAKLKIIKIDLRNHQPSIDSVLEAGREVLLSEGGADAKQTRERLEELNRKREAVLTKTRDRHLMLDNALRDAKSFHGELQDLLQQLSEIDAHLATAQPVGGLPETAKKQLDEFTDLEKVLDHLEPKVKFVLENGDAMLKRTPEAATERLKRNLQNVCSRWANFQKAATDRKAKLLDAVEKSEKFQDELTQSINWLTNMEKVLGNLKPVSRVVKTVQEQIREHENLLKDISERKEMMSRLEKMGTHLKYFSQKQDVVLIKNLLSSVQHRWEKINMRATDRLRHLGTGFNQAKAFETECQDLMTWLSENEAVLDACTVIHNDPDTIRLQIQRHKEFQKLLGTKQLAYDSVNATGRTLKEKGPKTDHPVLQDMLVCVKNKWNSLCGKSVDRQKALEDALLQSGQFKEALQALLEWLYKVEPQLTDNQLVHGDYDTVAGLFEKHKVFQQDLLKRNSTFSTVHKAASDMLERSEEDTAHLQSQLIDLTTKWEKVSSLSQDKEKRLDEALAQAEAFQRRLQDFQDWLIGTENHLRYLGPVADAEQALLQQLNEHKAFNTELQKKKDLLEECLQICTDILCQAHPDAVGTMKHWQVMLKARWEDLLNWARQRENKITSALDDLRANAQLLDELLAWLANAEQNLGREDQKPIPEDLSTIEQLFQDHQTFEDDVRSRQPEVDKVTKTSRQLPEPSPGPSTTLTRRGGLLRKGKAELKKAPEPTFRNPKVALLFTKWRQMWLKAMERRQKLQDALDHQNEIERMKHFNFDGWRDRYLRWMNNNKSRIMDFFRKQDRDHDGRITRQEFIDGILKSKFPTTSMEMKAVADIFDRDGDGFIDYKEFVAALKPERGEKAKPMTEGERIHYEIKRQAEHCSCTRQFRITKLAEGKYSFGDSQKLRLVRILRSNVMVRVGGGWMALDEFLVKNDPCRAKGRTNIDMREQFTVAEGVSQSMVHFKARTAGGQHGAGSHASSASSASGCSSSSASGMIGKKPGISFSSLRPHQKSRMGSDAEVHQILSKPGPLQKGKTQGHVHEQGSPCLEGGATSRGSSRPSSRGSSRPPSVADSEDLLEATSGDTADAHVKVTPKVTSARTTTVVTQPMHFSQTRTSTAGRGATGATGTRLPKLTTTTTTPQSVTKKTTTTLSSSSLATPVAAPVRPKKPQPSTHHK